MPARLWWVSVPLQKLGQTIIILISLLMDFRQVTAFE